MRTIREKTMSNDGAVWRQADIRHDVRTRNEKDSEWISLISVLISEELSSGDLLVRCSPMSTVLQMKEKNNLRNLTYIYYYIHYIFLRGKEKPKGERE